MVKNIKSCSLDFLQKAISNAMSKTMCQQLKAVYLILIFVKIIIFTLFLVIDVKSKQSNLVSIIKLKITQINQTHMSILLTM